MLADADLRSIQEARDAIRRSADAGKTFSTFDQARVDRICTAVVEAAGRQAEMLGRLAVQETGFGDAASKGRKNRFATAGVWDSIRDMPTVGVLNRDDAHKVYELAVPYGVVLGIIPCTNPTSTALFKILIALKTRNTMVLSPHPRAVRCIAEAARIAADAAVRAGAPRDAVQCLEVPTMEGTQAAMRHRQTALILATGGPGLVRSAYSAGKPAIGVGPGNTPAYVDRSADVELAAEAIVQSQVFDNGTICSSEQSLILDRPVADATLAALVDRGAYICRGEERERLARLVVQGRALNPAVVGLYPWQLAERAGFEVPKATTVLLSEEQGVGGDHPLSIEKLSPILAVYRADGWKKGCERCLEVLDVGGRGHTMVIHATDEEVIWSFAHEKPTHRVLVNSPASQGAVGFSTHLRPSMTLGCGSYGGNIASDNISAEHLLLRKRLAWVKPGFVEEEARRRRARFTEVPAPARHAGLPSGRVSMRTWPTPPRRPS